MKEKSYKRKQALKKARELVLRKKQLHKDVAEFLVDISFMSTRSPASTLKLLFHDGFKGYDCMRGRKLLKYFYNAATMLRDPNESMNFYEKRNPWGSNDDDRVLSKAKISIREQLILDSDTLMSRLMELAFNLDIEE